MFETNLTFSFSRLVILRNTMFPMKGKRRPKVIIHGSKNQTPRRYPMKAPTLLALLSQLRILLRIILRSFSDYCSLLILLQLSDCHFRIHVGCCCFYSVHVLVESGEFKLCIGFIFIFQLFGIECSE